MGGYISKHKIDPNDFEKILSELDRKIQKVEAKLLKIKICQRRTGVLVVTYSILAWLVYIAYCFLSIQQQHDYSMDTMASPVTTILAIPFGIYYTRRTLTWVYGRRHTIEEAKLALLRAQQKLKVEELKKTTSYYSTRSLLERYDTEILAMKKRQQQDLHLRKPVSMPGPRGMHGPSGNWPQNPRLIGIPTSSKLPDPVPPPYQAQQIGPPQWYDKIMDALIGEEGPETKYALICRHCFAHNGLVSLHELETIQYTCPNCRKLNPLQKPQQPPTSFTIGQRASIDNYDKQDVNGERNRLSTIMDDNLNKNEIDENLATSPRENRK